MSVNIVTQVNCEICQFPSENGNHEQCNEWLNSIRTSYDLRGSDTIEARTNRVIKSCVQAITVPIGGALSGGLLTGVISGTAGNLAFGTEIGPMVGTAGFTIGGIAGCIQATKLPDGVTKDLVGVCGISAIGGLALILTSSYLGF